MKNRLSPYFFWIFSVLFIVASGFWGWSLGNHAVASSSPLATPTPIASDISSPTPTLPTSISDDLVTPSPTVSPGASPSPSATPTPIPKAAQIKGKILMYHYVRDGVNQQVDPEGYDLSVSPTLLDHEIAYLISLGYHPITMAQLAAGQGNDRSVVMTFDDGYEDFYTNAYPIFEKYHWTATLYIIAGKIGGPYMTWSQIQELHNAGFEIGDHTIHHLDLASLSQSMQQTEILQARQTIEQEIGAPVNTFAYPSGEYNATTLSILQKAGFTSAVTTQPGPVSIYSTNPLLYTRYRMTPTMTDAQLAYYFKP